MNESFILGLVFGTFYGAIAMLIIGVAKLNRMVGKKLKDFE